MDGIIKLHTHCTSVHKEGDARSAPLTILQSLYYAKHDIDIISGSRVKTTFGRADWREVSAPLLQPATLKRRDHKSAARGARLLPGGFHGLGGPTHATLGRSGLSEAQGQRRLLKHPPHLATVSSRSTNRRRQEP